MRLLLDQNLSPRLARSLQDQHPGSAHVREFGLQCGHDSEVWEFAKTRGFTIVSKDADFHQRSLVYGPPPKVIWLRIGNCRSDDVLTLLRSRHREIERFRHDETAAFLALTRTPGV